MALSIIGVILIIMVPIWSIFIFPALAVIPDDISMSLKLTGTVTMIDEKDGSRDTCSIEQVRTEPDHSLDEVVL